MKNVWLVLVAVVLGFSASAQPKITRGAVRNLKSPATVVRVVPVYPPFYYGYNRLRSPFYRPFYNSFYEPRVVQYTPSELQLQLDDIENEYDFKISTVRRDRSVSGKERRAKIRELKHLEKNAVIDAKKDYYRKDNNSLSK